MNGHIDELRLDEQERTVFPTGRLFAAAYIFHSIAILVAVGIRTKPPAAPWAS